MERLDPCGDTALGSQTVTFTGTAGNLAGWPYGPTSVLVWADAACYVLIGDSVTATTSNGTPIPANTPIPFKVPKQLASGGIGKWRVSAVNLSGSATGNLYGKPLQN